MFEDSAPVAGAAVARGATEVPCAAIIRRATDSLPGLVRACQSNAERIDALEAIESLKCAAEAAQAQLAADFDAVRREDERARGVGERRLGKGVGHEVALARRESPVRGQQLLGLAKVLVAELPHTFAAMRAGLVSEHKAQVIAQQTACLSLEDRMQVDRTLADDPTRLARLSARQVEGAARAETNRLDPEAVVRRRARAEKDRTVTIRPAPDTMTFVTAHLPVAQGVAVFKALSEQAEALRAAGDPRSRGQAMADTLVSRVTGLADSVGAGTGRADGRPPVVPLAVELVMSERGLFAGDPEPARIPGYGEVPSALARDLVREALGQTKVWLRRLFTHPATGQLVQMDSRRRTAPAALADFIRIRDAGTCRTPGCNALIRHVDHVRRHADGGPTSAGNSQGLCEACNYAVEAPGWARRVVAEDPHTVETVTPTGHAHRSTAPPLPGAPPLSPDLLGPPERNDPDPWDPAYDLVA